MGDLRQDDENLSRRRSVLRREARIPVQFSRRPCLLVGITMATVFFAASIDAILWQQSVEREQLEYRATAAEDIAADYAFELEALELEVQALESQLAAADHRLDSTCEGMATADVGTLRYYLERAVMRGDWGQPSPAFFADVPQAPAVDTWERVAHDDDDDDE